MNTSVFCGSLRYVAEFKVIVSLARYVYDELRIVNYTDLKMRRSIKKRDNEVIYTLVNFIQDKDFVFSEFLSNPIDFSEDNYVIFKLLLEFGIDYEDSDFGYQIMNPDDSNTYKKMLLITPKQTIINSIFFVLNDSDPDIIRLMLENSNINSDEISTQLLPMFCSYTRHIDVIKILLEYGTTYEASLKCVVSDGVNDKEIIKLLLDHGADPSFDNHYAIKVATSHNDYELVKLLMKYIKLRKCTEPDYDYLLSLTMNDKIVSMFKQQR